MLILYKFKRNALPMSFDKMLVRSFKIIVLVFIVFVMSCDPYDANKITSNVVGTTFAINPSTVTLPTNANFTFSASGGTAPYTYSIVSGTGVINATTGAYTAPAATGADQVRVTDSKGLVSNAVVTITLPSGLGISPSAVTLTIGSAITFAATGGTPPYTYSVFTGGGVGETLNAGTGAYTAPTTTTSQTIRVTDSALAVSDCIVNVLVSAPLSIAPSSLTVGANASVSFVAVGGVPPYTYSVFAGGGIGETLNAGTGAYTAPPIAAAQTIRVTDATLATSNATVTITSSGILTIGPSTLSIVTGGSATFTAAGGVPPYTFSVFAGGGVGETLNAGTGAYVAPPVPTSQTIRVTDSAGVPNTSNCVVTVTGAGNVNYSVTTVNNTGGTTANAALTGNFNIQNIGTNNGTQNIIWSVYASTDNVYGTGDILVSTGTIAGGLTVASGINNIAFAGTWPSPNNYYLVVVITATDDNNAADNTSATALPISITPPPQPDYAITAPTFPASGTPGAALSGTPGFTIQETSGNPGVPPINWAVYVSLDTILDGSDTLLASGSNVALAGSGSVVKNFAGNWPAVGSYYYIIITISAGDDSNPVNNILVSSKIPVPYTETEANNTYLTANAYGITLAPGKTFLITGSLENSGNDYFAFNTGTATTVTFTVTWATGTDLIDIDICDNVGTIIASGASTNINIESGLWTVDAPGVMRYVNVSDWNTPPGSAANDAYTLIIEAN